MTMPSGTRGYLEILENPQAVARRGADLFARLSTDAIPRSGEFRVALSGGSTPRTLHTLLASDPYRDLIDWSKVQFYWGDDRYVAPDDPESNFRMAYDTLLQFIPIHEAQMHRIHTELPDASAAADLYEQELREDFRLAPGELPRFDLIFLGIGPDGHTCSLFPHTAALKVTDRLVVANYVPKLHTDRITLTFPVINNAANVVFLVAGADKASALSVVLEGPPDPEEYPAQLVVPTDGDLYWLVDRAAAARLHTRPSP
ncbi:MAG: 6-phosphogluconolactonase [Ktedonobacterales bacterium]